MVDFFTQTIPDFFVNLFSVWIPTFFGSINWLRDLPDIALVAFLIYGVIKLVRDSRAEQLTKGLILFVLAYFLSGLLGLNSLHFILQVLFNNALIIIIIIFQPELRRALEQVAQSRIRSFTIFGMSDEEAEQEVKRWKNAIAAVCTAIDELRRQKMGALLVFERTTKLGEIVDTGTVIDADSSAGLIENIFFNKAPLHDGAMILRDGRVYAAGCILPLSDNAQIGRELGTRHRAGLGMSENSDSLVVILSEETSAISLAVGGELKRNFTTEALKVALENAMLWDRSRRGEDGEIKAKKSLFRFKK